MKQSNVLKMSGLLLLASMTSSCVNSPAKVHTTDAACKTLKPISFAMPEAGEQDVPENRLDTERTALEVDAYNRDLAAICPQG